MEKSNKRHTLVLFFALQKPVCFFAEIYFAQVIFGERVLFGGIFPLQIVQIDGQIQTLTKSLFICF